MQSLVTAYQNAAATWRQLPRDKSVLDVEQRSRELLVLWIAFCLVHKSCVVDVPLCAEYNIALDWKDLKVAVLSERAAISALQNVAEYSRGWNDRTKGLQLFHMMNQGPTFGFARRFGLDSSAMVAAYNREVENWEVHVQKGWGKVERKKRDAAEIRATIARLQEELVSKNRELADENNRMQSLKRTLEAPQLLTRPLPAAKDDAIQVIFMLTMPRKLEILGNLCLTAQRALGPAEATTTMKALPQLIPTTWQQFYYGYAPIRAISVTTTLFTTIPGSFYLPGYDGPRTVDSLETISQYKAQCVVNPILRGTSLTWKDSRREVLNPFNVAPTSAINSFIERLPEPFPHFQWMNAWPGGDDTRGNIVYAKARQQPEVFEKAAFLALGSLRAFPNQQFRKFQWALLDDVLPWSHTCVGTIVRQALYQVGDLTDEAEPRLLWKTDMLRGDEGLKTFCATLETIAVKLEQTPRSFENVPLLSELAGYAHQFTTGANHVVKLFARTARRWAEDLRLKDEGECSRDRVTAVRQKECILYGYALLAFKLGPLDDEAVQEVCELVVLFHTSFLCANISTPSTEEMVRIESKVTEMMTRRMAEIIAYVERRGTDAVLTALLNLVSATSPSQLEWKRVDQFSENGCQFGSCFETSDSRYAINLFSGIVLTDGNAPGGLPSNIREHERFQSLFGQCNFEVITVGGTFQTESKHCERLYEFELQDDDELLVQEIDVDSARDVISTLQLCSASWIAAFSKLFPARLRELYSHWYWVERKCVLFRPKQAQCRNVYFVATFNDTGALQCYQVPLSDTTLSYESILANLDGYDRFVMKEESLLSVLKVLAKFEDEEFLHPLKSSNGVLKVELPRFKLSFCLNEEMELESVEHKGYKLATSQQFDDFLPRFSRYLVLELQDKSDTSRPEVRMLLPVGPVVETPQGLVDISVPSEADSLVGVVCYDVHRRLRTFETETIGARLQLAAVCVRAGTNVPSKRLQMTGAEAALQMLRGCRSSQPYSVFERETLETICKLSYREPAVKILAVALLSEAYRLVFLFGRTQTSDLSMNCVDEQTDYSDMCAGRVARNLLRAKFRSDEEKQILGYAQEAPPLPLRNHNTDAMGKGMLDELELSWNSYHAQPQLQLQVSPDALLGSLTTLLADVSSRRSEMENYLWGAFAKATSGKRDRLLALVNYLPLLTVSDIIRCAFDDEALYAVTLRLHEQAREEFKKGVLLYMEICVLEDKLERLIWKARGSGELSNTQLIDELVNVREWQSTEFPYWLAFEVEGRLQIRHEQYITAQHLINRPGTVCQLNMGRGKTRVILPMLFLHLTRSRCPRVVRAHFLGPLLSEARHFMHRFLSASSAQMCISEQPFHRQMDLDERSLELMRDSLQELRLFGGIQVVSPAHRMSLELKRLEVGNDESLAKALDEILDNDQFVDVLDECDALLHHKYHLIYAVGTPIPLCSGTERWTVAEALLRVVADKSPRSRVARILRASHVACSSPDYATRFGAFEGTRLNVVVESTEPLREELKRALVLDLVDNAPFELMWLSTLGGMNLRGPLLTALTNSDVSLQDALGDGVSRFLPYLSQLLALRGLVAFGVLEHCMEQRYRVDFGLPFPGSRSKKIAIPFRAADVPSERSEFSHPDVCIVLTLLGYYHSGLTDKEVGITFRMLLRLDISEQRQKYSQWFASIEGGLSAEKQKALCDVRHVSLSDARQFGTLCRVYKFCMEAINFYLNTCVFARDTQQYPQRLSRTAWNLAAGDNNIGFSGTNDNHRLLPLSVMQREPNESGTNGKMVDKIVSVTEGYEVIRPRSHSFPVPWQTVLRCCMEKHVQALIDTGALLAGVANHDAAEFLLLQPDFEFQGVTYYDSREAFNCWVVVEKHRRLVTPLKSASMHEKETFVIFDEARSRGSDMKLPHEASALLTLGPKLTKDKLMQGAGRMRQLGCSQTLWIASFDEVAQSVLQSSDKSEVSGLTAVDVLNWVVDNTKAESVRGLLEWAGNGIHFRKTQLDPTTELIDENWSLEFLYEGNLKPVKLSHAIETKVRGLDDALIARICERGAKYGLDDEVYVSLHTDECERELQVEEEVQQEQETELADCKPAKEKTWDYRRIFSARSIDDLKRVVKVSDVESFLRRWISPKNLAGLSWKAARIFGTEKFFTTTTIRSGVDRMNEFLRVIDVVLVFDSGEVLLVSEREADHILELLWSNSTACSFRFLNFAFACEAIDRVGVGTKFQDVRLVLGSRLDCALPLLSTVGCHLFNGETMLARRQEAVVEPAFRELLRPPVQREATLSNFVKSRGRGHKWARSFLHELCCRMDLEESSR
ncbi:hypothetical protein PHYSODRAFT_520653 [Phytophthora sojae]|uniref:ubiquitinyl hydrolase 1 n=1 Tax=Phytophthora sojae (strain P6497) TaxID=1094619 RepID=G4ZZC1_PHYSP|nr:hypothetical protein PHYSODRAFT_520653 [Phytophthora sojae]EGZ11143.1 hypothetical protein PHYSODRAFT_520653 [Phytophthora sojae]|eukprot:XP_009533888.1 hypothetical protein PHYSODRAFT_520653 [Phytophthora sojae]